MNLVTTQYYVSSHKPTKLRPMPSCDSGVHRKSRHEAGKWTSDHNHANKIPRIYWKRLSEIENKNQITCISNGNSRNICEYTVYPKKYAHGFVVLCFVVVMQSFIMNSHEVFIYIHQRCFAGTGAIVRLPQCQWSKPDGYGKISQCITTTKHSNAKTVCIFLGIYCNSIACMGTLKWEITFFKLAINLFSAVD